MNSDETHLLSALQGLEMKILSIEKAIKIMAILFMSGSALFVLIGVFIAATGYGLPDSWQYHGFFVVIDLVWAASIAAVFILSLLAFIYSKRLANLLTK